MLFSQTNLQFITRYLQNLVTLQAGFKTQMYINFFHTGTVKKAE